MMRQAATGAAIAAMALTAAPQAIAVPQVPLVGRLCAAHSISLPLPVRNESDRRDHPNACHAACVRASRAVCDEDCED